MNPIVLVENEMTVGGMYDHWQDVTGERYQFPNQYKNKVLPGREFLYYRGVRRADGTRGNAEYFGCGIVGSVELDPASKSSEPKARWKWICEIEDYRPFPTPVPAKENGVFFEDIPQNFWGVGVREITTEVFKRIVERAGFTSPAGREDQLLLPPLSAVVPRVVGSLVRPATDEARVGGNARSATDSRRSKYSRTLGRRGEEVVMAHLRSTLSSSETETLRWVADEGETPGWDIQYEAAGEIVAVEVKASGGPGFPSVEMTANEWRAAVDLGRRYRLALVGKVRSEAPEIQFLDDPASMLAREQARLETVIWRMSFR